MINLKLETIDKLKEINKSISDIDFYSIKIRTENDDRNIIMDSKKELISLAELDFNYDNGFGMQYVYGFVVLKDGSWLSRTEYDGSENWEHFKTPTRETKI